MQNVQFRCIFRSTNTKKMKTKTIIVGLLSIFLISGSAFGQEVPTAEQAPVKEESTKKEVRKEIQMEDADGLKTLTIITDENGVVSKEVLVGDEAEAKLAELMPQMEEMSEEVLTEEERIEVAVDDDGNLQSVTVKKSLNGEETIEVFTGEEAKQKLEELKSETGVEVNDDEKVVVKKKGKKKKMKSYSEENKKID